MVILGRELKPSVGPLKVDGRVDTPAPSLAGVAIVSAVPDLQASVQWYHEMLGLQLLSLGDSALLATDLKPGSFRLELLPAPSAAAPPTATPTSSTGSFDAGGGPDAAATLSQMAAPPGPPPPGAAAAGLGHLSLVVPSTEAVIQALWACQCGHLVLHECLAVTPVAAHGHSYTDRTSRIRDCNGYNWQLMEVHSGEVYERLCSVTIHVSDLHASLRWYSGVLGMRCHQTYESAETGYMSALVGYGPEMQCTLIELRQQWQPAAGGGAPPAPAPGTVAVPTGTPRLARFLIEAPDLGTVVDALKLQGQPFELLQLPSSEDTGASVAAVGVADADGWQFCFMEAAGPGTPRGLATMEE